MTTASSDALTTKLCRELGMRVPLFAFTRSREVVAEVTKAGGCGVLGAIDKSAEQLDEDLAWLSERLEGLPFGVDTVMPMKYEGRGQSLDQAALEAMISPAHRTFVDALLNEHEVGPLPASHQLHDPLLGWSLEMGAAHVEVSLKYPIRLIANALGTPPPEAIAQAHAAGVRVAALCGKAKQARRHKEAGVDIIVAQGWEAGGHTGEVAGMILCPEIVDAMGTTPVVMAGGIGSGRQMVAALALGAQAVWTGSIWLTTAEHQSHHPPGITEKLISATSSDTVRSRAISGKPARQLKTAWTEAWASEKSPGYLPMPLMWMVQAEAVERINHHGIKALMSCPAGQIVGRMNEVRPTAAVMEDLEQEARQVLARLGSLSG